jgi:hypothetical protein
VDRARLLGAGSPIRTGGKQIPAPEPRVLLLPGDRRGDLVLECGCAEGFYLCRIAIGLADDFNQGTVLQWRTCGLKQPAEW